jgi:hypothetical protein
MAGLVPGIRALLAKCCFRNPWMPGTSPGMTKCGLVKSRLNEIRKFKERPE